MAVYIRYFFFCCDFLPLTLMLMWFGFRCLILHILLNHIAAFVCSKFGVLNACYHSVQNLLSSRLLPKKLKMKIYRTKILPVVLYGCQTWSLTLR